MILNSPYDSQQYVFKRILQHGMRSHPGHTLVPATILNK